MAYGNYRPTAVEDNGSRKKKQETTYTAPVNTRVQDRMAQQRAENETAARQDAQNDAWKNVIDYSEPSNLTSNGQTVSNKQTGQTYVTPNYAQQYAQKQAEKQEPEESTARYYESNGGMTLPPSYREKVEPTVEDAVEVEQPQQTAGNLTVPEGYVTRPSSTSSVTAPQSTPKTDYTDEEISQMTRDRSSLVVPRTYSQAEKNKENTAGLPSVEQESDAWQAYLDSLENYNVTPDDSEWANVVDTGSALGNGYVKPTAGNMTVPQGYRPTDSTSGTNSNNAYTPSKPNATVGSGYVPTNILQSEDYNRVTDYSPENTVYVGNGQFREVGVDANGQIYDRPVGFGQDDFYYQSAIELGETPEDAFEYALDQHKREGTLTSYSSLGDLISQTSEEARDRYDQASENIPENVNRYDPDSAIDRYLESGDPERAAKFKAGVRDIENTFAAADKRNDIAQDYINTKMELDGKTRADYSNKEWNKLEMEAMAYAEEQFAPTEKADWEYLLNQSQDRWSKDTALQDQVAQQVEDLKNQPPSSYMPYGDPRQNKPVPDTGGVQTATPATTTTPTATGGYDQNVVDAMNKEQNVSEPASSGGGLWNSIVDLFTGGKSNDTETPQTKQERLDQLNQYLSENGYTPEAYNAYGNKTSGIADVVETPSTTTGGTRDWTKNPPQSRNEVAEYYMQQKGLSENDLTSEDLFEINALWNNTYAPQTSGTGTNTGTGTNVEKGKGSSSSSSVPKGSETYEPSYGQGGKVVKAPYKEGGYTEEELMKMGNQAWGKTYGYNSYEGYYRAPDGRYYPVDQAKADYYNTYGTYNGWDEGMRDYYNNFGTFSGYTPTWRSTGRSTGGGGNSYSYSGGGNNRSYGYNNYNNGYSGNNSSYIQPELTNQTMQRINNIMRNWTF